MITKSEISLIRSLRERRERRENGLFVAEGPKLVGEAANSCWDVKKIYAVAGSGFEGPLVCNVSPREMERISSLRAPQGVLAVVGIRSIDAGPSPLTLALDGIQDPGNMGSILRTADWFGIGRVVCSPDCADVFNPKVVQASMGAIFRVAVTCGELVFPPGTEVCGTFLDGEDIYSAELPAQAVIVLGNEGRGISERVAAGITRRLHIPSRSPVAESLNAAAAAAVVCSEFTRRTR